MTSYPRPSELTLEVSKEPVTGSCPECGAEALMAYPVLGEVGWLQVVHGENVSNEISDPDLVVADPDLSAFGL